MKKANRFIYIVLYCIAGLMIIIISCEKNSDKPINADKRIIDDARNYFISEVENATSTTYTKGRGDDEKRKSIKKTLQWANAFVKKMHSGIAVVIPLTYEHELFIRKGNSSLALSQLSYVLIYTDMQGKTNVELVTTFPDETYSLSSDGSIPFSGAVVVESWNGTFIKGFLHKNGSVTNFTLNGGSSQGASKTVSSTCITTDYYDCITHNSGYTWDCVIYDSKTICPNGGGEAEFGDDYPPTTGGTGTTGTATDTTAAKKPTLIDEKEPCVTGDAILDNSSIQQSFSNIWGASNAALTGVPMSGRKEQGGWIVNNNGKYSFVPFPSSWGGTPCGISGPANWFDYFPSNAVALVHSHPFYIGEDNRSVCGKDGGEASYTGGPSEEDAWALFKYAKDKGKYLDGYIIDGNRIHKYNWKTAWVGNNIVHFIRCGY